MSTVNPEVKENVQTISNEIEFVTFPIDYKIVQQLYNNTVKLIRSGKLTKSFITDSLNLQTVLLQKCLSMNPQPDETLKDASQIYQTATPA